MTSVIEYTSKHAEIDAIMKLPRNINLNNLTMYVVREDMKMSKPCEKCSKVISGLGIKKVYYSCEGKMEKLCN